MPSDLVSSPTVRSRPRFAAWSDPTVTLLAVLVVIAVIVFAALTPARFLSGDTVRAIAFQMPELGILSLAMMVPLMSGGLNLAIISTANLSALVMAGVLTNLIHPTSPPWVIVAAILAALLCGMLTCLVIGFLTGVIVAFFGVHPILVTLGTMTLVKGVAVLATSGTVIGGFPPAILFLGNGSVLGIPASMILFVLCAVVVAMMVAHTPFGVSVRLIGSNEKATRYSGVATEWVLVGVYVVSSLLCWVAALVMMARFNSASAGYAESYLLITILAAVLGGIDPFGGFGRVFGLFLSLVLLQVISTGFNLLGFSPYLTAAIWGATMIIAILIAVVRDRWIARIWPAKVK
ncbi:MAG: ABC transporter permease [Verrucomicrobia bacterium]|nr:ABC transporter permease [Verrucomicrobiota bacterium]